ncbi:MAG: hypothetical protein IKX22_11215 [Prevotella sp.]|nr:hypothetical protein [Prevotella sp.]
MTLTEPQKMKRIVNEYNKGRDSKLARVRNIVGSSSLKGLTDNQWKPIIKGGHQRRMPHTTVKDATANLKACACLSHSFANFEDLYDCVNKCIGGIPKVGPLAVYDIALRIGYLLNPHVLPKDYVYVSNGALKGFKRLYPGVPVVDGRVPIIVFKKLFGSLDSMYIEDILCIYKGYFDNGKIIKYPLAKASTTKGCV